MKLKTIVTTLFACVVLTNMAVHASILRISAESGTRQTASEVEADYTTTHVFVDEIAGDSIPITIFFDPQTMGVETAEVFTNLNRRDRADDDANGDGIHDGILAPDGNGIPAGNDSHYYKAYTMTVGADGYYLTLYANKTGAYRLTARYRLNGDPPGTYRWYGLRDHAIVVSPTVARNIRLYEVNTLNIEASGTLFSQRSTFEDLSDRPGAIHTTAGRPNNWNLGYVTNLGINWLWFQPYHPYGWEGRHESAANINARAPGSNATTWLWNGGNPYEDVNYPYALGSPYAVKNFWEIDPRLSSTFTGNPSSLSDVSSQANRNNAMTAFQNFVADADAAGVNIMPDAAFNHTAWDVELGEPGIATAGGNPNVSWMAAQGASGWSKTDLIHDRELRVFTRSGDYRLRANYYVNFFNNNIAPAPDRTDFGKWLDVCDVFFGRYAALVGAQNGSEQENYKNEGDWIDTTASEWNGTTGGSFDAFTRATWYYFAQYAPYWLGKTRPAGQNRNSTPADGDAAARYAWDARGIDGLRCDFGQGLPPQAWEYIINTARSYKWSFVFMAETLDGGTPPYRSNRHFDILNENILFEAKAADDKYDFTSYDGIFEKRRRSFGQGLVLLNTVSHDEDHYGNPWDAVARYAIFSTVDGAPMIFPGQELGIATFYGYDLMEKNFGKYIPHFKTYNSMMPLWSNTDFGNDQLYPVYAAINAARDFSPALRSSKRWFLEGDGFNSKLYGVAKYQQPYASPATSDVVLAFANLDRLNNQSDNFKIPPTLFDLLGLQDGRTYNVKNIAAYLNPSIGMTGRRDLWLWGSGITGAALKSSGFFVGLNKVPTMNTSSNPADPAWNQRPYEAQYLKVYDITAPSTAPARPAMPNPYAYEIGTSVVFDWHDVSPESGVVPHYKVTVTINGSPAGTYFTSASQYSVTASEGDQVSITVRAVNPDYHSNEGPVSTASETVKLLAATGDEDGDGQSNAAEKTAATNPLDSMSSFRVSDVSAPAPGSVTITWSSVPGKNYQVEWTSDLTSGFPGWPDASAPISASGTTTSWTDSSATGVKKFYRVKVVP